MTSVVGVIGGIGSGKSAVSRLFADRGALVLDADALAHRALERPDVIERVVELFGQDVVGAGGLIDRERLAKRIFSSSSKENRHALEAIVHPEVRKTIDAELDSARRKAVDIVILDVPLLLESKYREECDAIVYVETSRLTRLARVAERGWDAAELTRRESAQTPLDTKKKTASHVISNEGNRDELAAEVDRFLTALASR